MKKVEIYTASYCGYCHRAKDLLRRKNVDFVEYDVTSDQEGRADMTVRANGRTSVPQIFIGDEHIGGCDELHALDAENKLDTLLDS